MGAGTAYGAREGFGEIEVWEKHAIARVIQGVADDFERYLGRIVQPIRVAVTRRSVSPPIDVTVFLVGRERILCRLDNAFRIVAERAAVTH